MATTLENAASFARDPRVVDPLIAAIERAAISIMAEVPSVAHHLVRAELARQVVYEPTQYVQRFAWAVSTNDGVVAKWAAADTQSAIDDFQFTVSSVWDAVAGIATE